MSSELMVHTGTGEIMNPVPMIDRESVLRALRLDAKDPNTQALILTCERYGLDPILKHAVLIQGSLYVTRDGLMHVAHASGRFDGVEVEVTGETSTHFIAAATVWRKDMSRPFKFQGRYPKNGRMGGQYGPEMAEKVAICRALRHAFDVSLCSREELWDNEPEAPGAYGSHPGAPSRPAPAQITSAPNPPAPTKPPMDPEKAAAIKDFVEAAGSAGYEFTGPTARNDRDVTLCELIGIDPPSFTGNPLTAQDFRDGARLLREKQDAENAEPEAAAEPVAATPEPVAAAPQSYTRQHPEPEIDTSDLDDPFATPEPVAARAPSYAEHETTARRGRK